MQETQFKLCSLILLEKGTWLGITWGETMQVRLSSAASRSVIPGKLTLALSCWPEVGEAEAACMQPVFLFQVPFLCSFPGYQVGANASLLSGRISS